MKALKTKGVEAKFPLFKKIHEIAFEGAERVAAAGSNVVKEFLPLIFWTEMTWPREVLIGLLEACYCI